MEEIYKPKYEAVTELKTEFDNFKLELLPEGVTEIPESEQDIIRVIDFQGSSTQFDEVLQSVDLDANLSSEKDLRCLEFDISNIASIQQPIEVPEKARRFLCVQNALLIEGRLRKNLDSKLRYNKHKYTKKKDTTVPIDLVPFLETVLSIRFYEPFKHKLGLRLGHPKFQQEFLVLGSQYLTDLRNKIYCVCNYGPYFDISANPDLEPEKSSDPGFFFIHDTFYNDMRLPENRDYSDVLRKWAKKQKFIKELKAQKMEETIFDDLTFRLGYPQVYQHHGNCEHIFVISDARLLATTDSLVRSSYPVLKSYANNRMLICNICGHCEVNFIVKNSSRHIFDPAYICKPCFSSYHYKDGKKIGSFEAYRFCSAKFNITD